MQEFILVLGRFAVGPLSGHRNPLLLETKDMLFLCFGLGLEQSMREAEDSAQRRSSPQAAAVWMPKHRSMATASTGALNWPHPFHMRWIVDIQGKARLSLCDLKLGKSKNERRLPR